MILASAPLIVPGHEHDVDLAIATVVPLIFLTVLLPEISEGAQAKQFQFAMRGLAITAGFSALVVAFLQLAGKQTTVGTISGMILLLATGIFALISMAWPIIKGVGRFAATMAALVFSLSISFGPFIAAGILYYQDQVKNASNDAWFYGFITLSALAILAIVITVIKLFARESILREKYKSKSSSTETTDLP
ncbi:MAG: hypothetical protein ABSF03_32955 [Streptosporangiaceae bacterium]